MSITATDHPKKRTADQQVDARRSVALRRNAELSQAQASLRAAETKLSDCDQRITAHRTALATHKREMEASRDARAELVAARKHLRQRLARSSERAARAEARYDKAVLSQLVEHAKATDKARAAHRDTPASSREAGPAPAPRATTATVSASPANKRGASPRPSLSAAGPSGSKTTQKAPARRGAAATSNAAKSSDTAKRASVKRAPAKRTTS